MFVMAVVITASYVWGDNYYEGDDFYLYHDSTLEILFQVLRGLPKVDGD